MADENQSPRERYGAFRYRWAIFIPLGIAALGFTLFRVWSNHTFPYGQSHSCSKGLGMGLILYAEDHEGWFPNGGRTPESSLSLICGNNDPHLNKRLMRGKHLPQSVVDQAFARDGKLGPESCGWHYVEGLRRDDDPSIAIAWDKVIGLDHNGGRRPGLIHEVVRLDGSIYLCTKKEWPEFVKTEKRLLAETAAKRSPNSPPVRWSDEETLGPNVAQPAIVRR